MFHCAICGREIFTERVTHWFCKKCWGEWYDAIHDKAPWIGVCVNQEKRERRRALKEGNLIYLGDEFDLDEVDGGTIYSICVSEWILMGILR